MAGLRGSGLPWALEAGIPLLMKVSPVVGTPADSAADPQSSEARILLAAQQELRRAHAQELHRLRAEAAAQRAELVRAFEASLSWRLTAPLRAATVRRGWISRLRDLYRRHVPPPAKTGATAAPALGARDAQRALVSRRFDAFLGSNGNLQLPAAPEPDISILLVLYNQAELTYACLEAIAASLGSSRVSAEVLILDNGSFDRTSELLLRLEGAQIIHSPINLHFLRGVNLIAKEAAGRHLLLLNNDAFLFPGSVEAALATLESATDIGAVGGRIILLDGTLQEAGSYIANDGNPIGYLRGAVATASEAMFRRDVDYCSGAFLLTPRATWQRLGGFDERYAPAYFEETDYCIRLREKGLRVIYDPDAVIQHIEFGSSGSSAEAIALQQRNASIFRKRHAAWIATRPPPGQDHVLALRRATRAVYTVLVIDDRVPHSMLGAGFPRANDLLHAMLAAGADVTLLPMQSLDETWRRIRESVPAEIEVLADRGRSDLRNVLAARRGHYDAVLVSRPHNMRELRAAIAREPNLLGGAALIYDAEAVFAVREVRERRLAGELVADSEAKRLITDEVRLATAADAVITVTKAEKDLFEAAGVKGVQVLGHSVPLAPTRSGHAARRSFLFVGSLTHDASPNADSLRWFAAEILPLIRRELGPSVILQVAGVVNAGSILALDGDQLELLGSVPDLNPLADAAIAMVVPTRFAAGIPHKAHQAAALGLPIVTTSLIAEQLGWQPGHDLLVGDDAEGFAAGCIRLSREAELWNNIRNSALGRCTEDCDPATFRATVASMLAALPKQRMPA